MGKEKYLKKIEKLFERSPVVDSSSISRIVRSKKKIKQYDKQLIKNLLLKGKIKKLIKGYYTKYDEVSLVVFCFNPAYLGLQDALSFHNLWEQETIPIVVTTRKVRQGLRKVFGSNVLVRRIDKKYFFGVDYNKQGNFYLPYSNIEKSLIDMAYFNESLNEEVVKNALIKMDKKRMKEYLNKYPKKTKQKIIKKLKLNKM